MTDPDKSFAADGEEALRAAIDRHGTAILRYCHNVLCNYADAQDAAQITFIKAYEKRRRYTNGTSLRAWLYRIAYRTCVDLIRRRRFFVPFAAPIKGGAQGRADNAGYISEEIRAALALLKPAERALVFHRAIDGMGYAELEAVYNASAQTLRKRYERAVKKLADALRGGKEPVNAAEKRLNSLEGIK